MTPEDELVTVFNAIRRMATRPETCQQCGKRPVYRNDRVTLSVCATCAVENMLSWVEAEPTEELDEEERRGLEKLKLLLKGGEE